MEQQNLQLFGRRRKLGVVRQSEASECGLACLVMIANYHGNELTLAQMRAGNPISLNGMSLIGLMRDGLRLNLTPRALRLELEELGDLKTPCILHWDMQHFVVLAGVEKNEVTIHDPVHGVVKMSVTEAGKHFTGVALELEPTVDFRAASAPRSDRISVRSVMGGVRGWKRSFIQVLALSLVIEGFVVATPLYMQWVLDQVVVARDESLLVLIGLGFLSLTAFRSVVTALRSWCITWVGAHLNHQWEGNLFRHLITLPATFFERRHVGDVISRFTSVKAIQNVLSTQFVGTVLDGLMSLLTLGLMLLYSVPLTLCVLAAFALYLCLRWIAFGPLRRANEEKVKQQARQQTSLLEAVRGIRSLQLANQQASRTSEYSNQLTSTINRDVAAQRIQLWVEFGNSLIFGVCRVGVVWAAARMVIAGDLTAGMLVSFIAYADLFSTRGANFINQIVEIRLLRMHAERVWDIAATDSEAQLHAEHPAFPSDASLELRGLSFKYGRDEPWILRDASFRIESGECVAVVGPSGSGKSTFAKLILGLLEPESGQVLFGGVDIRKMGKSHFRSLAAAVLQDDTLFAGSIAANVAFFDPAFTLDDVVRAAKLAQIHDDIVAMPMGYNTLIGDMGSSLSGGQRQRVILARALYRQPRLLILDEATSHLDVACERNVNHVISDLKLTRIVIAHRPETIASASRIIDLSQLRDMPRDLLAEAA